MAYRRRIVDDVLDELFPHLATVALEGAKGVGKTATASQRVATVVTLSDPRQREIIAADPDHVVHLPSPVLVDEWQLEPTVWDRVRRAVDDDGTGGRFLLAGSAGVRPGVQVCSGAGRIVSFTMRPLAFSERGVSEPSISLGALLDEDEAGIEGRSPVALSGYVDEILRSGFPGIRDLPDRVRTYQLDSYLKRIVDRELPEDGVVVRRPGALTAWLSAYGSATATDAAYTAILDAATAGESEKPARGTVAAYREQLELLFVLDPLSAWIPAFNPLKRQTQTPKHHLVDPALAARLVGVGRAGLLRGEGNRISKTTGTWLGALFESLVAQSVRVYAGARNARVGHLRTKNGERDVDIIVEGEDRRIVAVEVKLAATVSDRDVRHLLWLRERLGDQVSDLMVMTTGEFAYRRPDGVAVVPLALLGP